MSDLPSRVSVTVRFWAGAQRAAGRAEESVVAATVGELRDLLAGRPELTAVCAVASFLVDGAQAVDTTPLRAGDEIDVLPPFAGGAPDDAMPLVVGIGGSTREGSTTNRLIQDCLAQVAARGLRTASFVGPALAPLPIYGDPERDAASDDLIEAVRAADCLVIGTPGYHGSLSGLVKNALDHLEPLRDDRRPYLDGRAVGIIVTASGWQACGTTLVAVRSSVHALRGWPTPLGVTVNTDQQEPDDPRVTGAIEILADQLVQFASWRRAADLAARR